MGSIIAKNLVEENITDATDITVLKKSHSNKIDGFNYIKNTSELSPNYKADLVFIAIKPQDAKEVLTKFSKENIFHKNTIFVSVLAGKKLKFLQNILGTKAKIIRSMPNLPIEYSQGIFAFLANKNITKTEVKNLSKIFDKFGAAIAMKDENSFDSFTAIFGSGPAYIFLLQEIFCDLAVSFGIKKDEANKLVKKLFLGSALMSEFSENNFSELHKAVTSKAGVTDAALKVFQKNSALKKLIEKAIKQAILRSKELSK